jgi:hypothetical protein
MKRRPSDKQIDAVYGLEPVFEPADTQRPATAGGSEFHLVHCPYCGEAFETLIDLSAGSSSYVEDCQVCCQPIEFRVAVDSGGALEALETLRGDG